MIVVSFIWLLSCPIVCHIVRMIVRMIVSFDDCMSYVFDRMSLCMIASRCDYYRSVFYVVVEDSSLLSVKAEGIVSLSMLYSC